MIYLQPVFKFVLLHILVLREQENAKIPVLKHTTVIHQQVLANLVLQVVDIA